MTLKSFIQKGLSMTAFMMALMIGAGVTKAAFGISPPFIQYDHIKAGTTYTETIILSTNEPNRSHKLTSSVTGDPELVEWIELEELSMLPKGKTQVPLKVKINVPADADTERYTGNIALSVEPEGNTSGLDINLGGNIKVDVRVVNSDFTDYIVRAAKVNKAREGDNLYVDLTIDNKGNIALSEADVEIEVWSQNLKEKVRDFNSSILSSPIAAYSEGETEIEFPLGDLPAGSYWANVMVKKGRGVAFETRAFLEVAPNVLPSSSVRTSLEVLQDGKSFGGNALGSSSVQTSLRVKSPYEDVIIYSILTVLILLGIGFALKHKK